MLNKLFSGIFGGSDVVKGGMNLIDEAFYTDSEKAEDKKELIKFKAHHRIELMRAYAPFKLAQRYLAFGYTFIFLFILFNGVLGSLYGFVPMANVENARNFADKMYLGEIILIIVSFYFGGGLIESTKRGKNEIK